MNSTRQGRTHGHLRDVVIELVLDAGESGVNTFDALLRQVAPELAERDDIEMNCSFPYGPAHSLPPGDAEGVIEIGWELARQGIATFSPRAAGKGWPGLRRSKFGREALRHAPAGLCDDAGCLRALRPEAADISEDAAVYLREAIAAFYMDCLLATCVMLSLAAESEFLRLLSVAKASKAHGASFSRISDRQDVGAKIGQFKEAITPLRTLFSRSATEELEFNLSAIQSVILSARNEPSARAPSRDQAHHYLGLFIPFARQAMRLRHELSEAVPSARVVWLH